MSLPSALFKSCVCVSLPSGASEVIFPKETIHAVIGGSVTLSAQVVPLENLMNAKVNVSKALTNEIVHLYRDGKDHLVQQSPQYKTRTALNHAHLEGGNVTLDISKLTLNDSGFYRLTVVKGSGSEQLITGCNITLSVGKHVFIHIKTT
ncbi:butyrophilin subfamily 2 member A1-like [Xyrichtys novacula]|uniref:Butyrophilin subfamily 2 member A1-like n=1 Tax=Xyrichtys novacula TaxID=13765 RepID=A0AAV1EVJ4_XYRNO|nr:butyrophilin subfamily 2 member A1-like [Xyrichtys novacula]